MREDQVGHWLDMMAYALAMNRKLQARVEPDTRVEQEIRRSAPADEVRALITRLNNMDPEGGWGRLRIGNAEFVVSGARTDDPV